MSPAPESANVVRTGFLQVDKTNGAVVRVLSVQYNPESLTRQLEAVSPSVAPRETVTFSAFFDAADKLEQGDALTGQLGILPALSALQLLLYPSTNWLVLWVMGSRRIVPVQITAMQIVEQAFDAGLSPIRAQVTLTLRVLKDSDLSTDPRGKAIWDSYLAQLQQLAQSFYNTVPLSGLGLSGI